MKATVVGAGVVGLSCAVRLLEEGWRITVVAEKRTPDTTSDIAAAIHFPFLAEPKERIVPWARATLHRVGKLVGQPEWGVNWVDTTVLGEGPGRPWWADAVHSWRRADPSELPPGEQTGLVARVPVLTMPKYLARIEKEVERRGGAFRTARVEDLQKAPSSDIVVNCTGLGARELAADPSVRPIRGQVVRVENRGVTRSIMREHDPLAYIIPRPDCVVLGGTAEVDQTGLDADVGTEETILRRCLALMPSLAEAKVVSRAVGLRPGRPTIRLELDVEGARPVVHCYGHGGSGVTLSWGCADDVVRLCGKA